MKRAVTIFALLVSACGHATPKKDGVRPGGEAVKELSPRTDSAMIVRISEIEIHPAYLEEYKAMLTEEAEASVTLEPGVIAIFPMFQKANPTAVRILEIYAQRDAYEAHIKSPHFLKYKTSTLKMVRSLRLVDMETMNAAAMVLMFKKMSAVAPR